MKKLVFILLFLTLLIPTQILAGGGLISWENVTSSNDDYNSYKISYVSPGEQFIVRPQVHLDNPDSYDPIIRWCKNCPIKIKLENPQPNDYIAQSSETTDDNGTMYAKIISYIPGQRYVYAQVLMPDGSTYTSSRLVLNYKSVGDQVFPTITISTPTPIQSGPTPSPTSKPTNSPKPTVSQVYKTYNTTQSTIIINSSPSATLINLDLSNKVSDLEKKLEESQKKQTFLEQKIEELTNFLRNIFPFNR